MSWLKPTARGEDRRGVGVLWTPSFLACMRRLTTGMDGGLNQTQKLVLVGNFFHFLKRFCTQSGTPPPIPLGVVHDPLARLLPIQSKVGFGCLYEGSLWLPYLLHQWGSVCRWASNGMSSAGLLLAKKLASLTASLFSLAEGGGVRRRKICHHLPPPFSACSRRPPHAKAKGSGEGLTFGNAPGNGRQGQGKSPTPIPPPGDWGGGATHPTGEGIHPEGGAVGWGGVGVGVEGGAEGAVAPSRR